MASPASKHQPGRPDTGLTVTSPFVRSLVAGSVAGMSTDLALFPLDTLKTRLQSQAGFRASGGFSGLYKGVGSAFVGAAPGAAAFFIGYDSTLSWIRGRWSTEQAGRDANGVKSSGQLSGLSAVLAPLVAGSVGEFAACTVRVPTEVCKQRTQTGQFGSSVDALADIFRTAHLRDQRTLGLDRPIRLSDRAGAVSRELYRGYGITVMREIPFSMIQFPIWEACKRTWLSRQQRLWRNQQSVPSSVSTDPFPTQVSAFISALAGVFSGSIAAAATTPLDVIKTRMMLAKTKTDIGVVARQVFGERGWPGFFAGVGPRVMWIGGGGFVFLGSYQWAVNLMGGKLAGGESVEDE